MGRASLVLITFSFALSACGHPTEKRADRESLEKASRVNVAIATESEAREIYRAPGTVSSTTVAALSSKVMGTLLEIRVRAGDRVKTGEVLAVVDSRETEAMVQKSEAGMQEARMALQEVERNLEASEANLLLASATLKRYQELLDQKSVSPQEYDEVQTRQRSASASVAALQAKKEQILARIQQAQADIDSSRALRSYAQIRSPLNGVVSQRQSEPGSLALPGMPLLTVEETGRYRLEVPVEERRIGKVKVGQAVTLQIPALGSSELKGKISEIQPWADPASRSYLVKISLPARSELRGGMYGEALFEIGSRKGIWIQPQSVVRQGQLEGAYVLGKENVARLRLLKLGETRDAGVEVLSGLEGGEVYVVQGMEGLRDGSRLEVLNEPGVTR